MSKSDVGIVLSDRIRAENPPAKSLKLCVSGDAGQQQAMAVKRLSTPEREGDGGNFSRGKPGPNLGAIKTIEFVLSAESNVNRNEASLNWVE